MSLAVWLGTATILGLMIWTLVVHAFFIESYRVGTQEDGWLEWATVWAFVVAAYVHGRATWARRALGLRQIWFGVGLTLFCVFVAGEEISWGQRLLGFRPPEYFLDQNLQQELNLHNAMGASFRALAFQALCLGHGVFLPLLARRRSVSELLQRLGLQSPSERVIPAFTLTALFAALCPFTFRMEVAEAQLGFALLLVGTLTARASGPALRLTRFLSIAAPLVLVLGLVTSQVTAGWGNAPELIEKAKVEAASLRLDFLEEIRRTAALPSLCGTEQRIHHWKRRANAAFLDGGHFRALVDKGLPPARARFFLDPWDMPYWIHHMCLPNGSGGIVFVSSFGPNRRRDSTPWALEGDDIGYVVVGEAGR